MKAYGRDRFNTFEFPDVADILNMGAKSSLMNPRGKGGDRHNSFRSVSCKARTRRIYKRAARRENKALCVED